MLLSLFMSLFNNGGPRLCLHICQGLHECRVLRWAIYFVNSFPLKKIDIEINLQLN